MLKKDVFGHYVFLKRMLVMLIGAVTFHRFNRTNKTTISGTEHLKNLPATNVLFVSNHQTYFADVIGLMHVLCSVKKGFINKLTNPSYLLNPHVNTYFIAAEETMKSGWLPKVMGYVGSVSIKRTFRAAGQDVNRKVEIKDIVNMGKALSDGWVITFPQGTTTPYAPGRRGVTHIIKKFNPVVVPVVIEGFDKAFDKKGFSLKQKGSHIGLRFKAPMEISEDENPDILLERIMDEIEQSERFKNLSIQKNINS